MQTTGTIKSEQTTSKHPNPAYTVYTVVSSRRGVSLPCWAIKVLGILSMWKSTVEVFSLYLKNVTGQVSFFVPYWMYNTVPNLLPEICGILECSPSLMHSLLQGGLLKLTVIRRQVCLRVLNYIKPTNPYRVMPPTDLDCHYVFYKRSTLRFYIQKIWGGGGGIDNVNGPFITIHPSACQSLTRAT